MHIKISCLWAAKVQPAITSELLLLCMFLKSIETRLTTVCMVILVCVCCDVIKMAAKGHEFAEGDSKLGIFRGCGDISAGKRRFWHERHLLNRRQSSSSAATTTVFTRASERTTQPSKTRK